MNSREDDSRRNIWISKQKHCLPLESATAQHTLYFESLNVDVRRIQMFALKVLIGKIAANANFNDMS